MVRFQFSDTKFKSKRTSPFRAFRGHIQLVNSCMPAVSDALRERVERSRS